VPTLHIFDRSRLVCDRSLSSSSLCRDYSSREQALASCTQMARRRRRAPSPGPPNRPALKGGPMTEPEQLRGRQIGNQEPTKPREERSLSWSLAMYTRIL
jgi:hypothetical protein